MSLLTSFFAPTEFASDNDSAGETVPAKMNLEERMAFRREVMFDVIRISLVSKGIPADSCRLRVSRADRRGHIFVVMIELPRDFLHNAHGSQAVLAEIGRSIAANAKLTELIDVMGVYWRVTEPDERGVRQRGPGASSHEPDTIAQALLACGHQSVDPRIYASDLAPLAAL